MQIAILAVLVVVVIICFKLVVILLLVCEEAKRFYLCLHLGRSPCHYFLSLMLLSSLRVGFVLANMAQIRFFLGAQKSCILDSCTCIIN